MFFPLRITHIWRWCCCCWRYSGGQRRWLKCSFATTNSHQEKCLLLLAWRLPPRSILVQKAYADFHPPFVGVTQNSWSLCDTIRVLFCGWGRTKLILYVEPWQNLNPPPHRHSQLRIPFELRKLTRPTPTPRHINQSPKRKQSRLSFTRTPRIFIDFYVHSPSALSIYAFWSRFGSRCSE